MNHDRDAGRDGVRGDAASRPVDLPRIVFSDSGGDDASAGPLQHGAKFVVRAWDASARHASRKVPVGKIWDAIRALLCLDPSPPPPEVYDRGGEEDADEDDGHD